MKFFVSFETKIRILDRIQNRGFYLWKLKILNFADNILICSVLCRMWFELLKLLGKKMVSYEADHPIHFKLN